VYDFIGSGKKGREVREYFRSAPFGWPQDATDASLVILTLAGNLRATVNGQPTDAKSLNQTQISNAGFSVDIPPLSVSQRLDLKALFQKLGISTPSGQETVAAASFLAAVLDIAGKAGCEPPAPEKPDIKSIRDLQSESGNAQLLAIHQKKEDLAASIEKFKKAGDGIAKRLPVWKRLEEFCAMAEDLPAAASCRESMSAIVSSRSLLSEPDQVPPLVQIIVSALRDALNTVQDNHEKVFAEQQKNIESNPNWKKLNEKQRNGLIEQFNLKPPAEIRIGTENEIHETVKQQSLSARRTTVEALPQRFAKAAVEAAIILSPKAVRIDLPAATVTSEKELESWIDDVRIKVKDQLKKGPAIL
jgi:hypothetical protein